MCLRSTWILSTRLKTIGRKCANKCEYISVEEIFHFVLLFEGSILGRDLFFHALGALF